jgi:hypothetical protein
VDDNDLPRVTSLLQHSTAFPKITFAIQLQSSLLENLVFMAGFSLAKDVETKQCGFIAVDQASRRLGTSQQGWVSTATRRDDPEDESDNMCFTNTNSKQKDPFGYSLTGLVLTTLDLFVLPIVFFHSLTFGTSITPRYYK